ncbi:phosphotransferase [Siccirubricoccus phaeus]|uniref:phosphotransferase n=1 Tax=Siccirubricoccus phaeus TaxID=2595053 RepID=UPI001A9C9C8F|nr:phosphotransferase [Siccirubricoccus phaeus]
MTPPLGRDAIARLLPHQGEMCLLDRVLAWDEGRIGCETAQHASPRNPLRRDGMLPAICGVEFALQAMALHGALTAGEGRAQPAGYLSSLREVVLEAERLDDVPGPLGITAETLVAEARGFIYRFAVAGGGAALLRGQAAVILP